MAEIDLVGHLPRDVELKNVNGTEVATFSIPDNIWRDGASQTVWYNCTVWEPRDFVKKLKKGDNILLSGSFAPRSYTDKNTGAERFSMDVRVYGDSVRFNVGGRPKTSESAAVSSEDEDDQPF